MSLDQLHLLPPAQQEAILNGPALAPPEGVIPILVNPPNQNALVITIVTILLFLATSVLVLAGYAKVFFVKRFYLEDYFAFGGYVFYVAKLGCTYALIHTNGIYVHQWNTRVRDLSGLLYTVHIESELYAISVLLLKTAILLEWVRIFVPRGTRSIFYWVCHTLIWLNVIFYTAILIGGNTSCKPYAKLWDKTLPGSCDDNDAFDVASAIYGFVSDTIILLLPHRVIWRLHMKTRKKVGIAIIFTIGLGACVSSAYRLYASIHYLETNDTVYGIGDLALGTDAELVCAVLVYYVPMLPKAFKDQAARPLGFLTPIFSRLKGSYNNNSSTKNSRSSNHIYNNIDHDNNTGDNDSGQELQDRPHWSASRRQEHQQERSRHQQQSNTRGTYYPNDPNPPVYFESEPAYPGWAYIPSAHVARTTDAGNNGVNMERGRGVTMQMPWHI